MRADLLMLMQPKSCATSFLARHPPCLRPPHIHPDPFTLGGDHDDDGHVRDWRWLLQEDSRPWLLPRKSVPAAVPHSWKREAPTQEFPRYQHHLTPRPILFRVVTSGKKELFDLKRRNPSKKTNKEGAFEWGPVPLTMRWVAGDLEKTRHKGLGVSPIHTLDWKEVSSHHPIGQHRRTIIIK